MRHKYCPNCGSELKKPEDKPVVDENGGESHYKTGTQTIGGAATITTEVYVEKRPWYKPPKTKRSKKNPLVWGYYFGWFLYVILRIVLFGLCCFLEALASSKK